MTTKTGTGPTMTPTVTVTADPEVPAIRITRDFAATPEQLFRAHTDADLFARWVGPDGMDTQITRWDATTGGAWAYVAGRDDDRRQRGGEADTLGQSEQFGFHGCFHEVRPDRIVQTFTFDGLPDSVALETLVFEDLGDGRTRLHATSVCASFAERDGWLASGMEVGVEQGYAKLDALLADGATDGAA